MKLQNLLVGSSALVAAVALSVAVPVQAATVYLQGFEVDTSGWMDADSGWAGNVDRVASGTDGINSAAGSWHAVMTGETNGPFSRFDGYRDEWPGEYTAEVDVYLDPAWANGSGFDYSVASSAAGGGHLRDFIFHVAKDTSTGTLLVAGDNNTNFATREDLETINHHVVTAAGWYTLQHHFYNSGGVLAVDLNLLDQDSNVLFTETRSTPTDTIPDVVGGNRYAWFNFIDVDGGIAVDEHSLGIPSVTTGEIFNPAEDEMVSGVVHFDAVYDDGDSDNDDAVQWAVRQGTCAAGSSTVAGNVDGFSDDYAWDGSVFNAMLDTSEWAPGSYCFVFNPTDDAGQNDVRLTRLFEVEQTVFLPTSKDDCKKDGYLSLTDTEGNFFRNQGQCVSYFNHMN